MADTVAVFVSGVMFALATLLPIINPPGASPIFLSLTPGASDHARTMLAARIARNSCVLLIGAMLVGPYVLMFFGLSVSTIRIAGGFLVAATAWHLLRAEHPAGSEYVERPPVTAPDPAGGSFYPLTFPVTIGPGSVAVAITLGTGVQHNARTSPTAILGAMAAILVISCSVYLCYRFASRLLRVLGGTGAVILLRFSAFILLAIGVQILCDGLVERFDGVLFR
jgi:multiple antibiotic resistance protein